MLLCLSGGHISSQSVAAPAPTPVAMAAEGYQYVRFVKENNTGGIRINEITFLNGSVTYPKLPIRTEEGSIEAQVIDEEVRNAYQLFDQDQQGPYMKDEADGESAITVQFNYPVYLTGVQITKAPYINLTDFRVEATNDLDGDWTLLYTTPSTTDNGDEAVATFNFGTDPVAVDTTPPTSPVVAVEQVTQNSVALSWAALEDAIGYEVFFDGEYQGFTASTNFEQEFTLSPGTAYQVEVIAYDAEYNASSPATLAVTTQEEAVAQRYRYLRLWLTDVPTKDGKLQLKEVNWLMGDRSLPLSALTTPTGNENVAILSTNENLNAFDGPFKAFDDQPDTHWYLEEGKEVTLYFQNVDVVPTGIEFFIPPYILVGGFRAEASVNGEDWTTLYEQRDLTGDDYSVENSLRVGRFDFGYQLPDDLDTTAPSVPAGLSTDQTTATFAQVSWNPSSDEGSGLASYRVLVNNNVWAITTDTEATIYALSPSSSYDINIVAIDQLGNESAPGGTLTVSTPSLETAVGSMDVGTGLGSRTEDIYKEDVDFAAEWASYATANPFSSDYIEELSHYQVLRFMNMVPINSNEVEVWADRRQPDDQDQRSNVYEQEGVIYQGMAYEWMIKLCNLTGSDFWAPVPHRADDEYVRNLANLIKEHLDPSLNVYLEYSNEVWNNDPNRARWFTQSDYATEKGQELGLDQGSFPRYGNFFEQANYARYRYYVYRSLELYDIFNNVFSNESNRVVKVLSGWAGQPNMTRVHLDALVDADINPKGIYPDRYAIAPYFGLNKLGVSDNLDLDTDPIATLRAAIAGTVSDVRQHYEILAESSLVLPLISYETGQHLTKDGQLYSRQPYMYQMYIEYMNQLAPYLNLFTHFVHVGGYGRGNAWGSKEYVGQPALEAYKYRAIKDWQQVNRNNGSVDAPFILEQPEQVAVGEGSGVAIEPVVVGERPLSFQWYKDGTLIPDETGSTLFLPQADGDAVFSFVVTNSFGQATSSPINLTVTAVEKVSVAEASGSVTVDGQVDAAWSAATSYSLENVNAGEVNDSDDLSASFKTLWDSQYLYVLVDVKDDVLVPAADPTKPWNYDAVELYIDATNDKTESYNANDRQLIYAYQGTDLTGGSGSMSFANAQAAQTSTANGYQVEVALSWEDLGIDPTAGHFLGFDIIVVDNDTPGSSGREGKLAWWTDEDQSWTRPANFGTALLERDSGTSTVTEEAVQRLKFTSVCSSNPAAKRRWRVRNPNDFPIVVTWRVYGTDQTGTLEAAPGNSFFTTATVTGANTTKIFWEDQTGKTRSATKASGGAQCSSNARLLSEEVKVYPVPAKGILNVQFLGQVEPTLITLTDLMGRTVLEQQGHNRSVEILLGGLPGGLYQLNLKRGDQLISRRVLVE